MSWVCSACYGLRSGLPRAKSAMSVTLIRRFHGDTTIARPDLDFDYLLDPANTETIRNNIASRKQVGDIDDVLMKWSRLQEIVANRSEAADAAALRDMWSKFYQSARALPNISHRNVPMGDEPRLVETRGDCNKVPKKAQTAEEIGLKWRALRRDVNLAGGHRAYALMGALALLQETLLFWGADTIKKLQPSFEELYVPDIVDRDIASGCGLLPRETTGIAYCLKDRPKFCLSGTGEMGIASYLAGQTLKLSDLPRRYLTQTMCFRPEANTSGAEQGLYRVHQFAKVEMFMVTANETGQESDQALDELVGIQKTLYDQLDFKYRVLDMPSVELGASASRKFDCEAWMPGRGIWGEVSSASNCTDYQSRRLGIRYVDDSGKLKPAHTCNATAIASPRLLIAVLESTQRGKGKVELPPIITKYIDLHEGDRTERTMNRLVAHKSDPRTNFDWVK